ncbi:hypothetical protein ACTXT7_002449 [Hymenolepis weldensis]
MIILYHWPPFRCSPWCRTFLMNMLNCTKCMQPIGSVEPVLALNKRWHPGCFVCQGCNCNLVDKHFSSNMNAPFCENCFNKSYRPNCKALEFMIGTDYEEAVRQVRKLLKKCSQPIASDQKYAVIDGKPFHATCFVCEVCQKSLYGGKYADRKGRITCLAHR